MDLFRQQLLRAPADFLKIAECIHPNFSIEGESYKRPLIKDQQPELAAWYNKKSWALISQHRDMDALFSAQLVDILSKDFKRIAPIYNFLMKIEGMKKSHNTFDFQ